jgi:hypothetical protein
LSIPIYEARQKSQSCANQIFSFAEQNSNVANLLEIEAVPSHFAGVIPRQTSSANVGPHGIDRAGR